MSVITGVYWQPGADDLAGQLAQLAAIQANTVCISLDTLNALPLAELRGRGLRIYADLAVFAGESLRLAYPDSTPVDAAGAVFDRTDWYVPACPNHPGVRRSQLERIGALLDRHGSAVDGLWLDFIRFPVYWGVAEPDLTQRCFCRHCLNSFLQQERAAYSPEETRVLARQILREHFDAWVSWKCDCIARFVAAVRAAIDVRDMKLQLGIFSLPWRRSDYNGAIRSVAGQDLALLANTIDLFSPMVYHKLCRRPITWIGEVVRDVQAWTQRPVLPIVQSMDRPDKLSTAELDHALQTALDASPTGVLIFTFEPVRTNADKFAVVGQRFAGIHGGA